jgi:hypothetical protein
MLAFDIAGLYTLYNRLMTWSYDVQQWAGNNKPWTPGDKE